MCICSMLLSSPRDALHFLFICWWRSIRCNVLAQVLEVPLQEGAYENNADIKVECGGTSTTASGGWSLGYIDGKSCGETAAQWFTKYFARFPSTRVGTVLKLRHTFDCLQADVPQAVLTDLGMLLCDAFQVSEDSAPTRFELVRCLRSHARPLDSFAGFVVPPVSIAPSQIIQYDCLYFQLVLFGSDIDIWTRPTQLPFSADINDQRAGVASPFKQRRIHVTVRAGCLLHLASAL